MKTLLCLAMLLCFAMLLTGCAAAPSSNAGTGGVDAKIAGSDAAPDTSTSDTATATCAAPPATCGDRICQSTESAACCGYDCDPADHGAAGCIDGNCHTLMLQCQQYPQCLTAVQCALHCNGDMTCVNSCAAGNGAATQLVFQCIDPACWAMH